MVKRFNKNKLRVPALIATLLAALMLFGCNGSDDTVVDDEVVDTGTLPDGTPPTGGTTPGGSSGTNASAIDINQFADLSLGECQLDSGIDSLICAAKALITILDEDELSTLQLDYADSSAKTIWSNLPTGNVSRNGLQLGLLDDESLKAAMVVARAALSDAGYQDFLGVLAADDYLNAQGGGSAYSSGNYFLAFHGEPDVSGNWMLQLGGHHLAYNITYLNGEGYPVPNHIGVEPKVSFELNSVTYAPLAEEADALVAMYNSLDNTQLAQAYLSGESYSDVLVGPDNGSGVLPTDYPTGSNRKGVLVSSLNQTQQNLVSAAIKQWISDYPDDVVENLLLNYTSSADYSDTYIAWAGTQSAGVDVDVSGTYMRIDGPNVWIEVACQGGVVIRDDTHYHTIFRDKLWDYGNSL